MSTQPEERSEHRGVVLAAVGMAGGDGAGPPAGTGGTAGTGRTADAGPTAGTGGAAGVVVATARRLGEAIGCGWAVVHGPSAGDLLRALEQPEAVALVVGPEPAAAPPFGARTRMVVEGARKPVVVVPPGAVVPPAIRRVLVPLEGTADSARPVEEMLRPLLPPTVRIRVLHVFTPATVPRMLDRPVRDLELLGHEFAARHCPLAHEVELRHGSVAARVAESACAGGADLVVLSWSQDASGDRARVVRSVLAASPVPVLLLPARRAAGGPDGTKVPVGRRGAGAILAPGRRP